VEAAVYHPYAEHLSQWWWLHRHNVNTKRSQDWTSRHRPNKCKVKYQNNLNTFTSNWISFYSDCRGRGSDCENIDDEASRWILGEQKSSRP